jgi:hypothetical protein
MTLTELNNPNFAAVAESVGIRGIRLEDQSYRAGSFVRMAVVPMMPRGDGEERSTSSRTTWQSCDQPPWVRLGHNPAGEAAPRTSAFGNCSVAAE